MNLFSWVRKLGYSEEKFDPSRRLFLRNSGLTAVAPIIAPILPLERITEYFFAPACGWGRGGNTLLTPTIITREALRILKTNLVFSTAALNTEWDFSEPMKVGGAVQIRMPMRYQPSPNKSAR